MRVALVHDWLTGMRGGEKVLEQLCLLYPEAPIYTLFHFRGSVSPTIERHDIRTSRLQALPLKRRHYRKYLPLFPSAIEALDLSEFDLVLSTSHCVAKGVFTHPDARHICYCHTPMRYAWDQQRAYFPESSSPAARVRDRILAGLRVWDVESSLRTDLFLANSHFVAQRIRRYYARDSVVVAPPVDIASFAPLSAAQPKAESDDFALAVAALAPYKKVDIAIEACRRIGLKLVVVGEGPERSELERSIRGGQTELAGRVDDERLAQLYRDARLFLQPGIEDFGIAAVEALASGTPVVALGRGGVLDIVSCERFGTLYQTEASTAGAAGEAAREVEIAALALALEANLERSFDVQELRKQAEQFSIECFRERIQTVVETGGL